MVNNADIIFSSTSSSTNSTSCPPVTTTSSNNSQKKARGRGGPRQYLSLRDADMLDIIKVVCPQKIKNLAALDVTDDIHGRQNSVCIKRLLQRLIELVGPTQQLLQRRMYKCISDLAEVNLFVKNKSEGLWSNNHFGAGACGNANANSGPICHCSFFAFGRRDPSAPPANDELTSACGHKHTGTCVECSKMMATSKSILDVCLRAIQCLPPGENPVVAFQSEVVKINALMRYHVNRYLHYISHHVRLCNEDAAEEGIWNNLKADDSYFRVTADWAMKYLPLQFRENMSAWFGKKGIAWHGLWVTWYDRIEQSFQCYYINQVIGETCESGEIVVQLLAAALKQHKSVYQQHSHVSFNFDGAGCYAGIQLASRLGYFFKALGVKVDSVSTGEAGGGKSPVDGNFGVNKCNLTKSVCSGMGENDISDYMSLHTALEARAPPSTFNCALATCKPSGPAESPKDTKQVKAAGLQSRCFRTYSYDSDGLPSKIHLFSQSGLGGCPEATIDIPMLWDSSTPLKDIVPIATGTSTCPESSTTSAVNPSKVWNPKFQKSNEISDVEEELLNEEEEEEDKERQDVDEDDDQLIICPNSGCIRHFTSKARLNQHLVARNCQSNGNQISRSSNPLSPTKYDCMNISDMAMHLFQTLSTQVSINEHEDVLNTGTPIGAIDDTLQLDNALLFLFGWASRSSLKHPPLEQIIRDSIQWAWDYGERTGAKISSASLVRILPLLGTEEGMLKYPGDPFWIKAFNDTSGQNLLSFFEIPEEWRVRQCYNTMSMAKKKVVKAKATERNISQPQRVVELSAMIKSSADLRDFNADDLAEQIVGLLKESERTWSQSIQKDFSSLTKLKREKLAMVEAVKSVERGEVPRIILDNTVVDVDELPVVSIDNEANFADCEDAAMDIATDEG